MFENRIAHLPNMDLESSDYSEDIYTRQYNTALDRFRSTRLQGTFARLKRKVMHRRQRLYDLNETKSQLSLLGSCYAGLHAVPIRSIIGSEGKSTDFDIEFHPLHEASCDRWVSIAMVYLARLTLPPIELIQVGDAYFVRDGHHRVSVSRAFGQTAIDAEVITWKASGPYPWDVSVSPPGASVLLKSLKPFA